MLVGSTLVDTGGVVDPVEEVHSLPNVGHEWFLGKSQNCTPLSVKAI